MNLTYASGATAPWGSSELRAQAEASRQTPHRSVRPLGAAFTAGTAGRAEPRGCRSFASTRGLRFRAPYGPRRNHHVRIAPFCQATLGRRSRSAPLRAEPRGCRALRFGAPCRANHKFHTAHFAELASLALRAKPSAARGARRSRRRNASERQPRPFFKASRTNAAAGQGATRRFLPRPHDENRRSTTARGTRTIDVMDREPCTCPYTPSPCHRVRARARARPRKTGQALAQGALVAMGGPFGRVFDFTSFGTSSKRTASSSASV